MRTERIQAGWILSLVASGLTVVILIWARRSPTTFLSERLGITGDALAIPGAWLLAVMIAIAYSVYTLRAVPFVRAHATELAPLKLIGIWAAVTSGIVEEVVFRKLIMDGIASLHGSIALQVLVSAIVFGAAHAAWVLLRGELKIAVPVVCATTVLGAALALLYWVADRNVLPCIVAHVAINLVIEPWLILAAISGEWQHRTPIDRPDT